MKNKKFQTKVYFGLLDKIFPGSRAGESAPNLSAAEQKDQENRQKLLKIYERLLKTYNVNIDSNSKKWHKLILRADCGQFSIIFNIGVNQKVYDRCKQEANKWLSDEGIASAADFTENPKDNETGKKSFTVKLLLSTSP